MSYPVARISTTEVGRARTADLWRHNLDNYADGDPLRGYLFWEDFQTPMSVGEAASDPRSGLLVSETATAGIGTGLLATVAGNADGIAILGGGSANAHEGVQAFRAAAITGTGCVALPSHATAALRKGRVIFEAKMAVPADVLTFVGLAEGVSGGILTTATSVINVSVDAIGFYKTAGGDLRFVSRKDDTADVVSDVTIMSAAALAAAGGIQKLGFAVNPDLSVDVFVNEVSYPGVAAQVTPESLPITSLSEVVAIGRGGGANTSIAAPIDWIGCFVED